MPSLKYFIKGESNPTTIYVRFVHGRKYDFKKSTSLLVNPKFWNNDKGKVKHLAEFTDKINLQNSLDNLRSEILGNFNTSYANGANINSDWLTSAIDSYFDQNTKTDLNYLVDYINFFLENLPNKILRNGRTGVAPNTIKKYRSTLSKVKEFEKYRKKRLKMDEVNMKLHKDFIHFLYNIKKLNYNTTGKYIACIKTICLDAKRYGLKVHPDIDRGEFRITNEKTYFVTLSENEIDKIFEKDFSNTSYLENARDWLIVGIWTGARVSDLLNLNNDNIKNGFIEYTAKKTNQQIILPIHWQVESIIARLNGKLPHKISSQKYNDYIKKVCESAGINQMCHGSKLSKKTKRKVVGEYPKWQLVSTHIARRTFATLHYGKLPTPIIMAATGHKSERMLLVYIGKTPQDNAMQLQEFWAKEKEKSKREPLLEIIKNVN